MKRSEIINIISNYFYESNVEPEEAEELGEELLAELEKAGMLPPFLPGTVERLISSKITQGQVDIFMSNINWEDEDETV